MTPSLSLFFPFATAREKIARKTNGGEGGGVVQADGPSLEEPVSVFPMTNQAGVL